MRYCTYVIPRCLIGAAPMIAGLYWVRSHFAPRSLLELVIAGIVFVLVFVTVWVSFVFRGDKYFDLYAIIKKKLGGSAS